jgi:triosephosphate isomerase (TIM)
LSLKRQVIAGNWKLNHSPTAAKAFFEAFLPQVKSSSAEIVFFPPAISLPAARQALASRSEIGVGIQNVYWETSGAFTGEISAPIAADAGATHALVGHSERRQLFRETDEEAQKKVEAVLKAGLQAILCVGETLEERESGGATDVVLRQLGVALAGFEAKGLPALMIAYEPVWAIGTGRTASPDDAAEMHRKIREFLRGQFAEPGGNIPILYGGSVKPENAAQLLAADEVGGLLVGGASLDPGQFATICQAAS